MMNLATKNIINKLETLPESLLLEVEDFIDFLKAKHSNKKANIVDKKNNLAEEPKSLYGAAKGLFIISDDFNEPLDDFKDYM